MIFDIVREINRSGTTVLLVEQNARAALDIADYGYVIETGAIAFHGTGASLLDDDRVRRAYLGRSKDAGSSPKKRKNPVIAPFSR
jgi:branched-chain amino acid transport system ATP-binding protein